MTKYNVGDKVRVIDVDSIHGGRKDYYNGMETVVVGLFAGYPKLRNRSGVTGIVISPREFHAIERIESKKPRKSERITALETEVAVLKAEVEALKQAKKPKYTLDDLLAKYPTHNQRRADVIKRAKAFVEIKTQYLKDSTHCTGGFSAKERENPNFSSWVTKAEFIVNSEKRTVVAIIRNLRTSAIRAKGIAKCDPTDVFNADIGKAIALARALGVEVPQEFVKAVQPTEAVVGQKVRFVGGNHIRKVTKEYENYDTNSVSYVNRNMIDFGIYEDTDAVYE